MNFFKDSLGITFKKSDLTLIEINIICEVPIYFKNTKKKNNKKKKIQKKKLQKKKFLRTDKRTDGRTTQNYSSEPHNKLCLKI